MTKNDGNRFGFLSIGLRWLMLLLLAAVYVSMELRGIFTTGRDAREAMKTWHYMLGLTVFGLVWIRLAARLWCDPAIQPIPPKWQIYCAQAKHVALCALMIVMPLIGWILLSVEGKLISLFGLRGQIF